MIPLNLFQTWTTKDLPPYMAACVASVKEDNPEFTHYLFDVQECEAFIHRHLGADVAHAYRSLTPIAFKADLWRYCVLYIHGGIYLDIKFRCLHGFRLLRLTDKEYFCNTLSDGGVCNAIMVCRPGNEVLKRCIDQIVFHVRTHYYGTSVFDLTGPLLLSKCLSPDDVDDGLLLEHVPYLGQGFQRYIVFRGQYALDTYPEYEEERRQHQVATGLPYYDDLYHARRVYGTARNEARNEATPDNGLVIDCQYYEGLRYHMEDALQEQGLHEARATNKPPIAIFSRAYYRSIQALDHTKKHDYCFIGSLASHPQHRAWVLPFVQRHFTDRSVFVNTDQDPGWRCLGTYDKTREFASFNPRQQPDNQSRDVQYRDVSGNRAYFETMCQSECVLCPAGDAAWSFRFYETLMCQSVPVVQSWHHTYRTPQEATLPYQYKLSDDVDAVNHADVVQHNTWVFERYHLFQPTVV